MATNYPAALDAFPDQPTLAAHLLSTDTHSRLHGDIGDAIRAIETYAGTSANPAAGTITYRLDQIGPILTSATSLLSPLYKTSNYTANAGELVVANTFFSFTTTLPSAPIDRTLVTVATNTYPSILIQSSGADTISGTQITGGPYVYIQWGSRSSCLLQYQASSQRWIAFPGIDYETSKGSYFARVADETFTGTATAPAWATTGLTGATTTSRWVGAVDGADPSSGTFSVGDYVVDRTLGGFRIYTAAGWRTVAPAGRTGAFRPITATATLDDGDYIVAADSTSGAITVNLPTAVGLTGKEYRIKRTSSGANDVTIDPNASETVDGATTLTLSSQWDVARIVSDGANWLRF